MRRFLCLTGFFLFCFMGYGLALDCQKVTKEMLTEHWPDNPFMQSLLNRAEIVAKKEVKGLCEVVLKVNGRFYPCFVGEDFVIIGRMYAEKKEVGGDVIKDLRAKEAERQKEFFLKKRQELDKLVAIEYKPSKKAKKVLYMFTDPVCPFCHRAETKIKEIVDKYDVVLKVAFFPVHLPKGKMKAIEAVCRGLDLDGYLGEAWRKENKTKEFQCEKGKKLLDESLKFGRELGIRGVPTFIYEDGTRVIGARLTQLEQMLSKHK